MELSETIKKIRTEKGVSQAEIARRLNLERGNYSRLENRGDKLSIEQLNSIAQALGVTLLDILTWGEEKPKSQSEVELIKEIEMLREQNNNLQLYADTQSGLNEMRKKYVIQQRDNFKSTLQKIEMLKKKGDEIPPELYLAETLLDTIAFLAGLKNEDF